MPACRPARPEPLKHEVNAGHRNVLTFRYIDKNIATGWLCRGTERNESVPHVNLLSSLKRRPFRAAAFFLRGAGWRLYPCIVLTQPGRAVRLRPKSLYRTIYDEPRLYQ